MQLKFTPGWFYGALIVGVSIWVLHSFAEALLAACVTAIASWPLYKRFAAHLPQRMRGSAAPLAFTSLMTVFVLAPLLFAFGALVSEAQALLLDVAAADNRGIAVPEWLPSVPLLGPFLAARWQRELAYPGALTVWTQRTDATALLAWVQLLGEFMARHAFIIVFTILLLFFLYQHGESLVRDLARLLRHHIGESAEAYVAIATRAVRASVNSVLVVGLFDGLGCGAAYALVGVPHAAVWAAITGLLALVPFLGYAVVAALALKLAIAGTGTPAFLALGLGSAVLFFGDKVVRPVVAREGTHLPFVWVLIGCLGGFGVLGLVGLVIGPVVLTLVRELWEHRVRELSVTKQA